MADLLFLQSLSASELNYLSQTLNVPSGDLVNIFRRPEGMKRLIIAQLKKVIVFCNTMRMGTAPSLRVGGTKGELIVRLSSLTHRDLGYVVALFCRCWGARV